MAQKAGWVAMLRAVNVGGNGKVPMAGLRELAVSLGFEGVKTIVNSGNLAFRAQAKSAAALESKISAGCQEKFGVATDALVRGEQEWAAVIAANPFLEEAKSDPARLVVMPLHHEPTAEALKALQKVAAGLGREQIRAVGRELFMFYPDGQADTKLTIKLIEKSLGTTGTGRNWNTVQKLLAALA
jgi:uncharacterized protein (DUF1697 family)